MHTTPVIASEVLQSLPAQQSILPWLDMLSQLYPPCGVVLVGAGSGSSSWVQYLMAANWRNVTLIEADEATARSLKATTQSHPSWDVKPHVIGPRSGPIPFYSASLHTESGLLEPETLRSLWPNLKTRTKQTRQAVSLGELLEASPSSWLVVDCLPARSIIEGAVVHLPGIDLIAARVVLDAAQLGEEDGELESLQQLLHVHGFRLLAREAGRHPAIGHALFVRDTRSDIGVLRQTLEQKAVEILQLTKCRDGEVKRAEETRQHLAVLELQLKQLQDQAGVNLLAHQQALDQAQQQMQGLAQAATVAETIAQERQEEINRLDAQLRHSLEQVQVNAQLLTQHVDQQRHQTEKRLAQQATEHDEQIHILRVELQARDERIHVLEAQANVLRQQTEAGVQSTEQFTAELAAIKQQLVDRDTRISALELKQRSLIAQREKLQRLLDEATSEQAALTQALDEKEHALNSVQAQQAETVAERARLQQVNERLSAEMTRAQAQIELIQSLQSSNGAVEQ